MEAEFDCEHDYDYEHEHEIAAQSPDMLTGEEPERPLPIGAHPDCRAKPICAMSARLERRRRERDEPTSSTRGHLHRGDRRAGRDRARYQRDIRGDVAGGTLNPLALSLAIVCAAATQLVAAPPFTGAFSGTGRACQGSLYVRTKTIAWLTPFSQCQRVPYEIIEQHQSGNERQLAFRLKRPTRGCRFGVIYLYHRDDPDQDIDWQVIGYESLDDYRADQERGFKGDALTSLTCYLVTRGPRHRHIGGA